MYFFATLDGMQVTPDPCVKFAGSGICMLPERNLSGIPAKLKRKTKQNKQTKKQNKIKTKQEASYAQPSDI